MSFMDHLEDLRAHLFRAVIAIVIGAVVVAIYYRPLFRNLLMGPLHTDFITYRAMCKLGHKLGLAEAMCVNEIPVNMQNVVMTGQITLLFTFIAIGGIILAFPYIFWEFWRFVKPALTPNEKSTTRGVVFWVSFLFFLGICFGYLVIAPYTVNFLASFTLDDAIKNQWSVTSYIDTMLPLVLGTGLTFQLPLVILFLTKIGIVGPSFLRKYRRHAIVIILIVAAAITPPDVISQCIVTLPIYFLYEISIRLSARAEKKRLKAEEAEWS
ncbi:MAG: twin arginine-targeting protein translocase TatC [Sphingobacteriales bacterium 12-47-4]|nr:MAG: twin arginine-targeting protein translocase TatC [Sphingobacteriales bacterium 12-47-4]